MTHPRRTCSKCKSPITRTHRFHAVHHKFLFFHWTTTEHRDCEHPTEIHKRVKRLKGEVPLPFPAPLTITEADPNGAA